MTETSEGGFFHRIGRIFGIGSRPTSKSTNTQTETKIPRSGWIDEQESPLKAKQAQAAYQQTTEGGFPKPGFSTSPSVGGTLRSPYEAAANAATAPKKVIDSSDEQQGRELIATRKKQTRIDNRIAGAAVRVNIPKDDLSRRQLD